MANVNGNSAKEAIKAYLDKRAAEEAQFAERYANKGKTLDECLAYITGEAYKLAQSGGAVCLTDAEVFGMAVHYYDEDKVEITQIRGGSAEVRTSAAVELTEDEKQQAREDAMRRFGEAYVKEQRTRPKKRKAVQEQPQQAGLFDLAAL